MSERSGIVLLNSIIECIDTILLYTNDMDFDRFSADRKTRDAVLMQLVVLGETANRVPPDLRKVLPDIEWGRIIRSRNIISHEYQGIDYQIIWRIITNYLPDLKVSILNKIEDF